jgi:Domain of unknown function (DUF4349)
MKLTDEQIGAELHALRENPSERFAAELDERVRAGFPPPEGERETRGWRDRLAPLFRPRMAIAYGATVLLVGTVAIAGISSLDDAGDDARLEGAQRATPESTESGRAGDAGMPPGLAGGGGGAGAEQAPSRAIEPAQPDVAVPPGPPVPPSEKLKPGQERVQERSASMTLSTEAGQVDDVADGVVEVTERYDGIVASSNVSTSDGKGRATFDLRIPSQNLQATLAELSDLADVTSRDEGVLDITAPFISAEERFDDAKAEVDALLDQLAEADSASEIASIREQLRSARGELAAARSELGGLKQRADFSRLSVTVTGDGDGDGWSIGDAAEDSVDVLEALGGAALVTLAVVIPLGGLALLAWFAATRLRQRRRESALDD